MRRKLKVFVVLSVLSLATLQRAFALDALVTKQGKVLYGTVIQDQGRVVITYDDGVTEEMGADSVDDVSLFVPPTRKDVARKGNFEVVDGLSVSTPIDMNKFRRAMLLALSAHRWVVDEERPGELYCRLSKGASWWVTIRICYTPSGYWYEYLDSKNLDANPVKNKIHRNYPRWIQILEREMIKLY
ncbi:MAG: hypothetical protein SPF89_03215 [Sphaerochaetaceae bacterium]|nr:hypothetical protein [Spirochaetales bacterium]MDY5499094.1 hypothetical protein [Sphaerochaetaceae bacterium]